MVDQGSDDHYCCSLPTVERLAAASSPPPAVLDAATRRRRYEFQQELRLDVGQFQHYLTVSVKTCQDLQLEMLDIVARQLLTLSAM